MRGMKLDDFNNHAMMPPDVATTSPQYTEMKLNDFCHHLMEGGARGGRLQPAAIAREFVDYFGLSAFPGLTRSGRYLRGPASRSWSAACENGRLRGYHVGTKGGDYRIEIDATDWDGAHEHTLLHETYEIVRERLRDLYPRIGAPEGQSKCRQADRFAAAALMQPRWFSLFAQASGLDVVALQSTYGRAYSSLTIRLAEVMKHQPLLAVLYERKEGEDPRQWEVVPSPRGLQGHGCGANARVQAEDK